MMHALPHALIVALLAFGPSVSTRESVQALAQRADKAFASGDFAARSAGQVRAWRVDSLLEPGGALLLQASHLVSTLDVSPDGAQVLLGSYGGAIELRTLAWP